MSGVYKCDIVFFFFFASRRRHTRYWRDWSSDVCSSDLSVSGTPQNEEPTLNGPSESPLCNSLCCSALLMDQPYQPPLKDFDSQNRGRSFQQSWYPDFPWLTLCTTTSKAFCHTCRQVVSQGLMTFSKCAEQAFTEVGFNNWIKAKEMFRKHERSGSHRESVLKLSKKKGPSIENMISNQEKCLQAEQREGLVKLISSLMYLLRQGLGIRGHTENESNLRQLLKPSSKNNKVIKKWLVEEKYMCHNIINELIDMPGKDVLNRLEGVRSTSSPWIAVIADEATDVSNNEQMNISIRSVSEDYSITEDPICLVGLTDTFSNTLVRAVKDALTRSGLYLMFCCMWPSL